MADYDIVKLRNNRAPRSRHNLDVAIRESLLSESTSGIDKGYDSSSTDTGSFSNSDFEVTSKQHVETLTPQLHDNHSEKHTFTKNDIEFGEELLNNNNKDISKIPDGGWGWVVVLSSFLISVIADGISFSFGLLYMEFLDEFQASKSVTAWIGSLFISVPLLSGPVMSALVDRYGCRKMTILGGIISCLGFVLASISKSMMTMMLTFGVIAGLGLGLVYVTAVVSIAYWFEKKRNLAMGLGACGIGIGTFIYAPLTQYLIEEYGWRGTLLILSGTLLNLCVCGCVMRDPDWCILAEKKDQGVCNNTYKKESNRRRRESSASGNKIYSNENVNILDLQSYTEETVNYNGIVLKKKSNILLPKMNRHHSVKRSESDVCLPTYLSPPHSNNVFLTPQESFIKISGKTSPPKEHYSFVSNNETKQKDNKDNNASIMNIPNQQFKRTWSEKYTLKREKSLAKYQLKHPCSGRILLKSKSESKEELKQCLHKADEINKDSIIKQISLNHNHFKDLSISNRNAVLNFKMYKVKASSCPNIFKNSFNSLNGNSEKWYNVCISCFSDMFNIALLKKPTFDLLCLGTVILCIWFIVPYFYLAEHMVHRGYHDDDGAVILSMIGIANSIGMVAFGWIGDFPKISVSNLYAVCLILCGVALALLPIVILNYWLLASLSSAFGLLFAASYSLTPNLLVKLVSLEDFTSAFGLVLLAMGIGHLIGPPLSGLIYDLTESWELCFYLAGGWIIVSGFLIAIIEPAKRYQERDMKICKKNIDDVA